MQKILFVLLIFFSGCMGIPKDVKPIENFTLSKYLGTWYEVARLDHSFERGLNQVTATYSLRQDGGVKVINRGYHTQKTRWQEAEGKAYFVKSPDIGYLKVSFFGPFYGSYIILALDYEKYALICGPNTSYLWILSRTPTLEESTMRLLIQKAVALGFETDRLIYIK
ncbi:MAG: lipocalin family protein [Epsilonproteobacteria bacterium]|nr:lipocalin family protein [Campylobacterota bacterium]